MVKLIGGIIIITEDLDLRPTLKYKPNKNIQFALLFHTSSLHPCHMYKKTQFLTSHFNLAGFLINNFYLSIYDFFS